MDENNTISEDGLGETENVRVVVRVRPMNRKELESGCTQITKVDTVSGSITVTNPLTSSDDPPRTFTFDIVFDTDSRQLDIYNETARPIVDKVLQGYNGTIFAYGQTGTGKTFTMEGDNAVNELKGIIPNSFAHIFGHIAKAAEQTKFLVRVAYVEIYNEEVRDLLSHNQTTRLEVKERPDVGVYISDLTGYVCNNADDMSRIMAVGNKNRKVGSTAMNDSSSRSHAIFTITIENEQLGEDGKRHIKMGKLHLVDLAGSERQSKTGASGVRLKEAAKINLSLSTLGNVISALVDGKSTHVPYRNSKLTRLLQDSLGGNSKTVMCANIGPASYNYEETISTLRYANRAKTIRNRARVNEDPKDALLKQFQNEIEELRKQLDSTGPHNDDDDVASLDQHLDELKKELAQGSKDEESADGEKEDTESQSEHVALREKLERLERKILIGGENLLEKAEVQQQLLEASALELEQRRLKEDQLKHALQLKTAEIVDIEERYSSLQEEATGKTKKLKKVFTLLMSANAELADLQHEQQREMEGLLDSVRTLTRELRLQDAIIAEFVPRSYEERLERFVQWNEDIGEWQLKCVAYSGNNMRKTQPIASTTSRAHEHHHPIDLSNIYLSYTSDRISNSVRPPRARTARTSIQRSTTQQ